ncbi:unnamed protein product [Echinostoma caproni]|uniref:Peptidase A2 domain-containing protein n=1 Tax=Echinostoma caproni TaxID=27848 RepID=A0A183B356_9TREM|nr:unnamed protein product [Echinostoma caproni]
MEKTRKYLTVRINGEPVRLQIDTASDITLISKRTCHALGRPAFNLTNRKAFNVSGGQVYLIRELVCDVSFKGMKIEGTCYVTNRPCLNLMGLDWIEMFGLLDVPLNSFYQRVSTCI